MKNLYLFSVFFICISFSGKAQDTCLTGMKYYWKMNENSDSLVDVINNAVAKADTSIQQILGIVDSAQSFKGSTKVTLPSDTIFNWKPNSSFSIEFWMKKTTGCSEQAIRANNVIIGRDDPASPLHWWAGVSCEYGGKFEFDLFDVTGAGKSLISNKNVVDGKWHHLVIVRKAANNTTTIYIDGAKDTSVTFTYTHNFVSTAAINIGWLNLGQKYYYNGILDELAIYNISLNDSIITSHYNSGNGMSYCKGGQVPTAISNTQIDEPVIFSVYPTLVSSELNVHIKLQDAQNVTITACDISGRKICDLFNNRLFEGDHTLTFGSIKQLFRIPNNSFVLIQMKLKDKVYTRKVLITEK